MVFLLSMKQQDDRFLVTAKGNNPSPLAFDV